MNYFKQALKIHKKYRGKLSIHAKVPLLNKNDLSIAYTPGVAEPCREIFKHPKSVYQYTIKGNSVAVITNGTAVLGLGDIGPQAALPVMEGKCLLFKKFADIDAYPICLDSKNINEIIKAVELIAPGFGGINLEDIAAPDCFVIEKELIEKLDIPVFHDDQHGTAIVVLAGLMNALKIVKKDLKSVKIAISGAGAAGIATTKILLNAGAQNIILSDSRGAIYQNRPRLNWIKKEMAKQTNPKKIQGELKDIVKEADIFIGLSAPKILTAAMVKTMKKDAVIFAMSNPVPEIMPNEAEAAGAKIIATGRSDFPNQINNVLAFPGVFRGALDNKVLKITQIMKIKAAEKLANLIKNPTPRKIIPSLFDKKVIKAVASAIK